MVRFVALGDSLTEGVGDPHPACPNGLRGWADLLAARLGALEPEAEYANLALRAKRAADVLAEQVEAAVAMRPDVVTLWAGGNDILRPRLDPDRVLEPVGEAVRHLRGSGATVLLLTGFELSGSPVLGLLRHRVRALNAGLHAIAASEGAGVVDVSGRLAWADPSLWAPDRVHPSPIGHARLATEVGRAMGVPLTVPAGHPPERGAGTAPSGIRDRWHAERVWWRDHVGPHVRRWVTRASAREDVTAKWSTLVRPASDFGW